MDIKMSGVFFLQVYSLLKNKIFFCFPSLRVCSTQMMYFLNYIAFESVT